MKIQLTDLSKITESAYRLAQYPEEQIRLIIEVLSYAQCRGNMQSLLQIAGPGIPSYHGRGSLEVVKDTSLSCLIDGKDNIGIWVMAHSMNRVLDKAQKHGFAIGGSFNAAPPGTAALGYYVKQIAEQGLIGFAFCGSSKKIAPYGGYQALFGSNPIAVGLPCPQSPIVIDMSTSVMPVFKVLEARLNNKALPKYVAYDNSGAPTEDPKAVLEGGALTVFGNNPKGYSLSMLVEILTGPLVGASFATCGDTKNNWGNLIYAFDPELLVGRNEFMTQMSELRHAIKTSPSLVPEEEVFLPGEMSDRNAAVAKERGWIEVDDNLYHLLKSKGL